MSTYALIITSGAIHGKLVDDNLTVKKTETWPQLGNGFGA